MTVPGTAADPRACAFYRDVLARLETAGVPFLVGGAYALEHQTGIARETKDLDIFIRRADRDAALRVLADAGYETELTSEVWLAKIRSGNDYVDVIFSSGNAIAEVDDVWFEHAEHGHVLGVPVAFCPPEETIWSKSYVMERERYDGADVAHVIRACGRRLDWARLVARFGAHWRVLLAHLVLFGFVYPSERTIVPEWVTRELVGRLDAELRAPAPEEPVCQGTLLSRYQYRVDVDDWGQRDGRMPPSGKMTPEAVEEMDRES
jgi:hypothetical protein